MGVVYKARDPQLDRLLALKLLHDDDAPEERQARLLREARALARVSHSNVVQVFEAGLFQGSVYLAIEFVSGGTLAGWMEEKVERSWIEVVDKIHQAGLGLAAAHEQGIVHRDFKPANVLIGSDGVAKVTDFGIARAHDDNRTVAEAVGSAPPEHFRAAAALTSTGTVLGTPAYMSPEQIRGERVDALSDQFSFCVVLYEALVGTRPFTGDSVSELRRVLTSRDAVVWPAEPKVPARLRAAIERGLSRAPERRWPTLRSLLEELQTVAARPARVRRVAGLTSVAALVALTTWGATSGEPAPDCDGIGLAGEIVSEQRIAALHRGFERTELAYAVASASSVTAGLAEFAEAIDREETLSCKATHEHGTQSAARLDERASCFAKQRDKLELLLVRFAEPSPETVLHAVAALEGVARGVGCDGPGEAFTDELDPEKRARADKLRSVLTAGFVSVELGDWVRVEQAMADSARLGAGLGLATLETERLTLVGRYAAARGRDEQAVLAYQEAVDLAEAAGRGEAVLELWRALLHLGHGGLGDPARAKRWRRRVEAVAQREGLSAGVELDLDEADAAIAALEGRTADAIDLAERVLATHVEKDDGSRRVAQAQYRLANIHHEAGEYELAVEGFGKSYELYAKALGAAHPVSLDARLARLAPQLELGNVAGVQEEIGELVAAYALDPDHTRAESVRTSAWSARLAQANGDLEGVIKHASGGLRDAEGVENMDPVVLEQLHTARATAYYFSERFEDSVVDYRRALELLDSRPGSDADALSARSNLGEALTAAGDVSGALAEFELVEQGLQAFPEFAPDELGIILRGHADALAASGAYGRARKKYGEAILALERSEGLEDELVATRKRLAELDSG
jgi:tetratricopeptide (TPR) repeat protein